MTIMPKSDQFVTASERLEGYKGGILVDYVPGRSPSNGGRIRATRTTSIARARSIDARIDADIRDKEMNVACWRQYGNTIKNSTEIRGLWLGSSETFGEISQEAALCLRAFFEELKENTSIEKLRLDCDVCMAVSEVDLRYFLQHNQKLRKVSLFVRPTSYESDRISTALRDVSLNRLILNFMFSNRISFANDRTCFEHIILACRNVKILKLEKCFRNYEFASIVEQLRDPRTSWEDLHIETSPYSNLM